MWGEGGVLWKMMDDVESDGYVSFPVDYYKFFPILA